MNRNAKMGNKKGSKSTQNVQTKTANKLKSDKSIRKKSISSSEQLTTKSTIKNDQSSTMQIATKSSIVKTNNNTGNQIILPPIKKMERSHSFFLTRKLSKIYNSLTSSKDSLNKIPENDDQTTLQSTNEQTNPFKFIRSATFSSIPLRRSYRRSSKTDMKLEQLREEDGHHHYNQQHNIQHSSNNNINNNENDEIDGTMRNRSHTIDGNFQTTSMDRLECYSSERKNSFNLISSLKRTFSVTPAKRKKNKNPKWSASLMSLQQIDVMISYEDLSFIDYDKFNTYEATLNRHLSQTDELKRCSFTTINSSAYLNGDFGDNINDRRRISQPIMNMNDATPSIYNLANVKRRRHKSTTTSKSFCSDMDPNNEQKCYQQNSKQNFDATKNVYRQSLNDKIKLEQFQRKSFRWSNPCSIHTENNFDEIFYNESSKTAQKLSIMNNNNVQRYNEIKKKIEKCNMILSDANKVNLILSKHVRALSMNDVNDAMTINDNDNNKYNSQSTVNGCHSTVSN